MHRKTYHILVPLCEESNIDKSLRKLRVTASSKVNKTNELEYTVKLSKYELLYVRLSCNNGKMIKSEYRKIAL